MRSISSEVTPEALLGGAIQVVVGRDQHHQLSLDVHKLGKVGLNKRNPCFRQIMHESQFGRLKGEDGFSLPIDPACCATNAMDIATRLVGRIELDNQVNSWNLGQD